MIRGIALTLLIIILIVLIFINRILKKSINKHGKAIDKWGICLNVLLNYSKYRRMSGRRVKIIKNNGYKKYDKLIGKIGFIYKFEFENFEKPIVIRVYEGKVINEYCYSYDEIELI